MQDPYLVDLVQPGQVQSTLIKQLTNFTECRYAPGIVRIGYESHAEWKIRTGRDPQTCESSICPLQPSNLSRYFLR
ncbi:hypothetical protein D3C84_422700 [compost metagenome]